ncbi:MAG: DUF2071 domain-containing protein [Acidobacteriales bacterium]|nr:DUF2071 domain-containing protein [Terriglobales bacterium]
MASTDHILQVAEHRPFPLPSGPWVMQQSWNDLLFAHWPLRPEYLRQFVPQELALDLFDNTCWIAVTPFHMTNVRPRLTPELPWLSAFAELNVRTYVVHKGVPGVFFFSLDAARLLAVWGARYGYRLPYFHAKMRVQAGDGAISYSSRRLKAAAEFRGSYQPTGPARQREKGSLEHFLTERYRLFTVSRSRAYRGDIHHVPWPLQDAEAEIEVNTMAQAAGLQLPQTKPLLHFAKKLDVLIWPLRRVM